MPDLDLSHLGGWVDSPKDVESIMAKLPFPIFSDVWTPIKGTGIGKIVVLTDIIEKVTGKPFKTRLQTVGDCQNPTDLVRMSDGSEKMIKDVQIGDYVLTPYGNSKRVIDKIVKPYNKSMVKLDVKGYNKCISSTPDHLYMVMPNFKKSTKKNSNIDKNEIVWKPIVSINEGDYILLPKISNTNIEYSYDLLDYHKNSVVESDNFSSLRTAVVPVGKIRAKGSPYTLNRFIKLDEKLSWLIGIYSAEGGIDNGRVTFNLSSEEILLAEKIKRYIKDIFDFDATISKIPSKPSVLYVRVQNILISNLFKNLCLGNIYSKELNKSLLLTNEKNKLQLLSGWMDGDGHKQQIGISVSEQLIHDYFQIANSLGMCPSIYNRKAYKQSKKSYTLDINKGALLLANQTTNIKLISNTKVSKYGRVVQVKKVEIVKPDTDYVYCIGVEDDHAFICNGFGIHNCVSMATALGCDISKAVDIWVNKDFEEWIAETSTEDIYGGSRVIIGRNQIRGDGSVGAWAAKWVTDYGCLPRGKYGNVDTTIYSGSRARTWGSSGVPQSLIVEIKKHPIQITSQVTSYEQARDLIANGYPIAVCSNLGFSNQRDKNGVSKPSGSWAHCMCIIGVWDDGNIRRLLVQNSWGIWNGGPKTHNQPDGSFWVEADIVEKYMFSQNDSWAFSGYTGFEPKEINTRII